ncbi:hypothetical protein [Limnohabitans sp. JirII-31]|uniref:hypothetical protein n=1 Tax=Limnohabitans sp. JirII-31 TaxID=1977908 RepID=UPI001E4B8555|nr:hypothetical protein [Limnohabitans sp. JirII-31]
MDNSALKNLSGPGKSLKAEPPDNAELAGLMRTGSMRLRDAQSPTLALESQFDLAYNAAHALCLAALRHKGYRPSNRFIVFQVLPHTLGLGPEVWRVLDKCHNTRNLGEYEGMLDVNARLVSDLISATQRVLDALNAQPLSDVNYHGPVSVRDDLPGGLMAKGEQHSNKMTKKPKKDNSPPKTSTSDRPNPPTTYVAPRGKIKNK